MLAGNSNTHGIFGVACEFKRLTTPFEACSSCQDRLENYTRKGDFTNCSTNYDCNECLGWSIDKLCATGKYETPLSGDFDDLTEGDPGFDLLRGPCRIPFEYCIAGWEFAINKYINEGSWTASKTSAYLKLFCCNEMLQKKFLKEGRQYILIRDSLSLGAEERFDPEDLSVYRHMSTTSDFHLPKHPAVWSLFTERDITETPMHLTMGSVKAVLRTLIKYTACRDRQQDFIRRCNEISKTVQELRIDLVPLLKFKDEKFGGFVAENYSAMAMVLPWLSHVLQEKMMEPPDTCPVPDIANKPLNRWTGKECKAWLAERGHKGCSKLKAAEAKAIVCEYLNGPDQPEIVDNPGKDMPPEFVRSFLFDANSLFSTIMLDDLEGETAKNRAQALVGCFLSQFETIDKTLIPNRAKPIWYAKYNMLGLLRVPEHYLRHRHFRNQYEGGMIGEGMVKCLRKMCPNAVREGWSRNIMKSFYRNQAMDGLFNETMMELDEWSNFEKVGTNMQLTCDADLRKFRRYKGTEDIVLYLKKGYPVSVVVYRVCGSNLLRLACVTTSRNQGATKWSLFFFSIIFDQAYADCHGCRYFSIEMGIESVGVAREGSLAIHGLCLDCFAILLPSLWTPKDINGQYKYAVVNENWQKMDGNQRWTSLSPN
jgi:hypothetical protein